MYLAYLTHRAPLPTIGYNIFYSLCDGSPFNIECPNLNELPKVCEKYYTNFFSKKYLKFSNLMDTIYWFLAQVGSVVVVSTNLQKIVTTTEILRTIIYPFEYHDTYILPLPRKKENYLDAPFPCLIGMPVSSDEEVQKVAQASFDKTLIVNVDSDQLWVNFNTKVYSIKEFKQLSEYDSEEEKSFSRKSMPKIKLKELESELDKCRTDYLARKNNVGALNWYANEIRNAFLGYFTSLFKDYRNFFVKEIDEVDYRNNIRKCFRELEFIEKASKGTKTDFFTDFFETRCWLNFLEMVKYPQTVYQYAIIKTFTELINRFKKQNKNFFKRIFRNTQVDNSWLRDKRDKIKREFYFVPQSVDSQDPNHWVYYHETIDYTYSRYLEKSSEHFGYAFSLAVEVMQDNYNYRYKILPELCNEFIPAPKNSDASFFTNDLSKTALIENQTLRDFKTHTKERIGLSQLKGHTKKGDVYLIWVIMWCLSFKYCNNIEKIHRVNQLIAVLDLFRENVPEFKQWEVVFEETLKVILKNGNNSMIVKVMQLMHYFGVKVTQTVCMIFFDSLSRVAVTQSERSIADKHSKPALLFKPHKDKEENKKFIAYVKKSLDYSDRKTKCVRSMFRKRTFRDYANRFNWMIEDVVTFIM